MGAEAGPSRFTLRGADVSRSREHSGSSQLRGFHSGPPSKPPSHGRSPVRRAPRSPPVEPTQAANIPPHRRAATAPAPGTPSVLSPLAPTFKPTPDHSSSSRESRAYSPAPFLVTLPPEPYIELSKRESSNSSSSAVTPKLLVLDLNGALIYRAERKTGEKRKAYPRPYLSCFLEYLFLPEPVTESSTTPPDRPWEIFVWSSAQSNNVRAMVEVGFGMKWIEGVWEEEFAEKRAEREKTGEGRLLGVWARDQLGLSSADYGRSFVLNLHHL